MNKRKVAAQMLAAGASPGMICKIQGNSLNTVLGYLDEAVGNGSIQRSDILFTIPEIVREAYFEAEVGELLEDIAKRLVSTGVECSSDDLIVVDRYADATLGDMYVELRNFEVKLHTHIKNALCEKLGCQEGLDGGARCAANNQAKNARHAARKMMNQLTTHLPTLTC